MAAYDESNYVSSQHLFAEQRVVRSSFSVNEGIVIAATVSWRDAARQGGKHDVTWRILQGDRVLKKKDGAETLGAEPAVILSHISAKSFSPGDYRVTLLIDRTAFAEIPIRLAAIPRQKTSTDLVIGPNCSDGPNDSIRPIQPIRPVFPSIASEHKLGGCALVAIVLDEDGHPADVKVLAEHPNNADFGGALKEAGWNTFYPPGHAGEVSFLRVEYAVQR